MSEARAKIKTLFARTPQGAAGSLHRESQYVWRYETQDPRCALSLAMPLRASTYNSNPLHPIFAMNLPEGEQLSRLMARFGKQFAKFDEMAMLSIVGAHQIGRVQVSTQMPEKATRGKSMGLQEILSAGAGDELFSYLIEHFYVAGISGVQPKVLVPDSDIAHAGGRETALDAQLIVKTGGSEYPYLSQNEYLCMSAAQRAGIEVPECHLSANGQLFVMRRFDLAQADSQLGFEDIATLASVGYDAAGHYKYKGSYEGIARVVAAFTTQSNPIAQRQKLFEYVALSCMVRNGDAHLKNFGLLYQNPDDLESVRLSPLYDVVTTSAYDIPMRGGRVAADRTLALKLNGATHYPDRKTLCAFGTDHCLVDKPAEVIERIEQAMIEIVKTAPDLLPRAFAARLTAEWEAGIATVGKTKWYAPLPQETLPSSPR